MSDAPPDALASRLGDEGVSLDAGRADAIPATATDSTTRDRWLARRDLHLALVVGGVAFVVYLLTLSRGVLGGDAGELQFVPPILGLTHPTGYPLQVLLHYAWSLLPIGSVAFRLNLLDALIAAGAVGVLFALARAAGAGRVASALGALSLAFGELWWSQAVRGDKYTLNGLFLALMLLLFLRWRAQPSDGRLYALAFVFGLSLAHHRSMLLAAPALLVGPGALRLAPAPAPTAPDRRAPLHRAARSLRLRAVGRRARPAARKLARGHPRRVRRVPAGSRLHLPDPAGRGVRRAAGRGGARPAALVRAARRRARPARHRRHVPARLAPRSRPPAGVRAAGRPRRQLSARIELPATATLGLLPARIPDLERLARRSAWTRPCAGSLAALAPTIGHRSRRASSWRSCWSKPAPPGRAARSSWSAPRPAPRRWTPGARTSSVRQSPSGSGACRWTWPRRTPSSSAIGSRRRSSGTSNASRASAPT